VSSDELQIHPAESGRRGGHHDGLGAAVATNPNAPPGPVHLSGPPTPGPGLRERPAPPRTRGKLATSAWLARMSNRSSEPADASIDGAKMVGWTPCGLDGSR